MKHKVNFSKRDIVVVLSGVGLVLLNIGAIGSGGRRRAKEMVCLSNLRQWGEIFQSYTNDNNGYFYSGVGPAGFWWVADLEDRYQSYKQNRLWFCPTARTPMQDEHGALVTVPDTFKAWGIFNRSSYESLCEDGIAGSYGLNAWVLNAAGASGMYQPEYYWRRSRVEGAANIPVFLEAKRFDSRPLHYDTPPAYEAQPWSQQDQMGNSCFNRHNGAVNALFMDWSARKVGLKKLWTLKWHRQFYTEGPWTRAGGVQPSDWPQWMRDFRDY